MPHYKMMMLLFFFISSAFAVLSAGE